MCNTVYRVHIGGYHSRLERALAPLDMPLLDLFDPIFHEAADLRPPRRILFTVAVDEYGNAGDFYRLVCDLRKHRFPDLCIAGVVIDGESELYTKSMAQELILSANMAGCAFPGKPLVEGTGSLYNQHILAQKMGLSWEETYFRRIRDLHRLIATYQPPRYEKPRLLMLHASDNRLSNTVWMGKQVLEMLPKSFETREICLQNGTIHDCRGCSFEACSHFAENGTCFYGGAIAQEVLPAIRGSDVLLFLCPNYNDAVSANMMALFNRLTNLLTHETLMDKSLFGIVVSGYSGSDLVARQLLGAMCLNKTVALPPRFCLMQTAHDPGSAEHAPGIGEKLQDFAANIAAIAR